MKETSEENWIKKNGVIIGVIFWGVIGLLIWSPWVDRTYSTSNSSSNFTSADCKNIEHISAEEMYEMG